MQSAIFLHPLRSLPRNRHRNIPATPVRWINIPGPTPAECQTRPRRGMLHLAMLHGVEVDIIHLRSVIPVVADRVFPTDIAKKDCLAAFKTPSGIVTSSRDGGPERATESEPPQACQCGDTERQGGRFRDCRCNPNSRVVVHYPFRHALRHQLAIVSDVAHDIS